MHEWLLLFFLVQVGEFDLQGLHRFLSDSTLWCSHLVSCIFYCFYFTGESWSWVFKNTWLKLYCEHAPVWVWWRPCWCSAGKRMKTCLPTSVHSEKSKQNPLLSGAIFTLFSQKNILLEFHWIVCDFSRVRSPNCVKDGEALPKYMVPVMFMNAY